MNCFDSELKAISRANRFRHRKLYDDTLTDFASNDYLGLAQNKTIAKKSANCFLKQHNYGSKSSMIVNGYHDIHYKLEKLLCQTNGFESGIIVGSGYLANISLFESMARRGDMLVVDENYHASGMMASRLSRAKVEIFAHNDTAQLETILRQNHNKHKRIIVAIEGVYSMSGDMANPYIYDICDRYEAILIVDEAHSSGVVGENLNGWFDYNNLKIRSNHIKMATFGKAYGSYGAYILGSRQLISYLENRAKPIIYSTALSLFDTIYAYYSVKHIQKNRQKITDKIKQIQATTKEILSVDMPALILPINQSSNTTTIQTQNKLQKAGFAVGAIRQPTVKTPIIRIIPKINIKLAKLKVVLDIIKNI